MENAFILGGFVKQASYRGSEYDGKVLDEARQLKESTLRLYPNHPERDRLRDDLRKIEEAKAAALWQDVQFYQRKGRKPAIAVYCREILRLHPATTYADRARQLLQQMQEEEFRREKTAVVEGEPLKRGEPRRLFSLPKLSFPKLSLPRWPRLRTTRPRTLDSRSDSEKEPAGRIRI